MLGTPVFSIDQQRLQMTTIGALAQHRTWQTSWTAVDGRAAAVAAVSVRGNCIRLVSHSVAVKAVT